MPKGLPGAQQDDGKFSLHWRGYDDDPRDDDDNDDCEPESRSS